MLGMNYIGIWDANCACADSTITGGGCDASFWAIQAMTADSSNPNGMGTPIPYEIWVWNLSSGTNPMTYFWDFGDGSSSSSAYPTHTYAAGGPYLLCLTIADASGCTSTYCDSISIDGSGILVGMATDPEADPNEERMNGFTINVQNPITLGTSDAAMFTDAALWPNPASEAINLALIARADGPMAISVIDASGREVLRTSRTLAAGRSQHSIGIDALPGGIYTLRATDRSGNAINLRFAK